MDRSLIIMINAAEKGFLYINGPINEPFKNCDLSSWSQILVHPLHNITFENSQTMKLFLEPHLLSLSNMSVSLSSMIYDPCNQNKRCVCSFFASLLWRGSTKTPSSRHKHTLHTVKPISQVFARLDEEECREIWPRACDKWDQRIRCLPLVCEAQMVDPTLLPCFCR